MEKNEIKVENLSEYNFVAGMFLVPAMFLVCWVFVYYFFYCIFYDMPGVSQVLHFFGFLYIFIFFSVFVGSIISSILKITKKKKIMKKCIVSSLKETEQYKIEIIKTKDGKFFFFKSSDDFINTPKRNLLGRKKMSVSSKDSKAFKLENYRSRDVMVNIKILSFIGKDEDNLFFYSFGFISEIGYEKFYFSEIKNLFDFLVIENYIKSN